MSARLLLRVRGAVARATSRPLHIGVLLMALAAASASCAPVRLISDYDPGTDEALTRLHRDLEGLLLSLEETAGTPEGAYGAYAADYRRLRVDLRSLRLRAESRERNELQVEQLEAVEENLGRLERAHGEGLRAEEVELFRRGFHQQLRAILTLELAKRRGEGP
jgi:hypothetical protein